MKHLMKFGVFMEFGLFMGERIISIIDFLKIVPVLVNQI